MTCSQCRERPSARRVAFSFRMKIGDAQPAALCDDCTTIAVAEYVELHATAPTIVVDARSGDDSLPVVVDEELPHRSQIAAAILSYDLTGHQWYDDPVLARAKARAIAGRG